jgi:hypothetical protein
LTASSTRVTRECESSDTWTSPITPAPRSATHDRSFEQRCPDGRRFLAALFFEDRASRHDDVVPSATNLGHAEEELLAHVLVRIRDAVNVDLGVRAEATDLAEPHLVAALDHLVDVPLDRPLGSQCTVERGYAGLPGSFRTGPGRGFGLGSSFGRPAAVVRPDGFFLGCLRRVFRDDFRSFRGLRGSVGGNIGGLSRCCGDLFGGDVGSFPWSGCGLVR